MNGGDLVVETLIRNGVDTVFTVSGESFLAALEAMRRRRNAIRLVTVRQEGGGTFAAEAYGKLTGRPAAVFVSRGPGATNAAIGVHTAKQDSTPLLLFIGDVRTRSRGKEAFQEIDQRAMFAPVAKAVFTPASAAELGQATADAVAASMAGRPGPVVVVLPRDLTEADVGDAEVATVPARAALPPAESDLARAADAIDAARRPLLVAGEMIANERVQTTLAGFADAAGCAVTAAYRRQDVLANAHPAYVGHLEINRMPFQRRAFAEADLVIAAGTRLDGITAEDGSLIRQDQRLIHIYPEAETLARWQADIRLLADCGPTLQALVAMLRQPSPERLAWRDELHRAYDDFATPGDVPVHGAVDLAEVAVTVRRLAGPDAVVLTDGGSFARWVHRYCRFELPATQAGPMSGAMGYAVPGAIGARLARPDAPVVAFVGDGGFMMTGQELVTAREQNLRLVVIVCDNAAHGSILQGQQRAYGDEADYGTRLVSPDFAAVARGYGLPASTVERTADFPAAFAEALRSDGPVLLHLLTDRRDIAPFAAGKDAV